MLDGPASKSSSRIAAARAESEPGSSKPPSASPAKTPAPSTAVTANTTSDPSSVNRARRTTNLPSAVNMTVLPLTFCLARGSLEKAAAGVVGPWGEPVRAVPTVVGGGRGTAVPIFQPMPSLLSDRGEFVGGAAVLGTGLGVLSIVYTESWGWIVAVAMLPALI